MLRAQLSCIGIEKPLAAQCCHSEEFLKQLLELCESSLSSVADGMAGSGGADTPGLSVDSLCSCLHVLRVCVCCAVHYPLRAERKEERERATGTWEWQLSYINIAYPVLNRQIARNTFNLRTVLFHTL